MPAQTASLQDEGRIRYKSPGEVQIWDFHEKRQIFEGLCKKDFFIGLKKSKKYADCFKQKKFLRDTFFNFFLLQFLVGLGVGFVLNI